MGITPVTEVRLEDMTGIAIEKWRIAHEHAVIDWLREQFGAPNKATWFVDLDYDLMTLCMNKEIATWYYLRWT